MTPQQFAALRALLTADLSAALRRIFLELAGWHEPDQARFVRQARPLVLGGQRAMASATAAQIADRASVALGRAVPPPRVPAATRKYLRRDVSVEDVYRRPFASVYAELAASPSRQWPSGTATAPEAAVRRDVARGAAPAASPRSDAADDVDADVRAAVLAARERVRAARSTAPAEATEDDVATAVQAVRDQAAAARAQADRDADARLERAVAAGARRLEQLVEMDMQQAHAVAAAEAMQNLPEGARPTGWRRVLVGEVNCALCVVASTQRYRIADLNPIHPACDCAIEPLYGDDERVIDPDTLEAVHAAVAELTGRTDRGARTPDYRELLIGRMTPEHGELGPMLAHPRHRFRSKFELPT